MSRLDHFTPLPLIRVAVLLPYIELMSSFWLLIRAGQNLASWARGRP
jgi:hypothetical protein